ncbi:hypothetical protein HAX54_012468 [Datura stramonium]|uniref:Uncharacterized protein n=1 Tax=Datura stramonium TaxID=4076 RepID=A0ABS8TLP0_DATST|nr:hypothetical protein [Datura stramonium]
MDLSEEETVDCCKVESPKLQAEPSRLPFRIDSSSGSCSPLFSLTPDEFHGKNLDDLLNKFWDIEGNPVTSNPNQEGGSRGWKVSFSRRTNRNGQETKND